MTEGQMLKKVGLIFCGGCNCYYDREKVWNRLLQSSAGLYRVSLWEEAFDKEGSYDLVVVINGCSSECMVNEKYRATLLVIHNLNYENAAELVEEALRRERGSERR